MKRQRGVKHDFVCRKRVDALHPRKGTWDLGVLRLRDRDHPRY